MYPNRILNVGFDKGVTCLFVVGGYGYDDLPPPPPPEPGAGYSPPHDQQFPAPPPPHGPPSPVSSSYSELRKANTRSFSPYTPPSQVNNNNTGQQQKIL